MKRLFLFLLFVLVGAAVTGYFRGWFTASTTSAGGKSGLTFTWDPAKFKADVSAAGAKISSLSKAAMDKIGSKTKPVNATQSTLAGKVTAVDAQAHTVTVDADGQTVALNVPEAITGLDQLVGKNVTITLDKVGEHTVVSAITAID